MREEVPAAALAASLEDLQDRLIDQVCGPKWLPVRGLPAPFGCPGCGVMSDFARKGKRTRPRRFATAAGVVRVRLANVGCRSCGRVFAPLLLMLDLSGKRRTDRLMIELAELASQMSFARAGAVAAPFGAPGSAGRAHSAVADLAPLLDGDRPARCRCADRRRWSILDGTGMRAGRRRLGVNSNIALGVTAGEGPRRRRQAETVLLGLTLAQPWSAMAAQLQACAAGGGRGRRRARDHRTGRVGLARRADPALLVAPAPGAALGAVCRQGPASLGNAKRAELVDLLRAVARERLTHAQALAAYDAFIATVTAEGHHAAGELLAGARDQVFTCLRPKSAPAWPTSAALNSAPASSSGSCVNSTPAPTSAAAAGPSTGCAT